MQKYVGIILKTKSIYKQNPNISERTNWLRYHVLLTLLVSIIPLVISLIASISLNNYTFFYPIPILVSYFLLLKFYSLYIYKTLDKNIEQYNKKSKIIVKSIFLYLFQSILYMIPLVSMLLINLYTIEIFNIFMIISLYVYLLTSNYLIEYLYTKRK